MRRARELGHSSRKIIVRVKKKEKARGKFVTSIPGAQAPRST